MRVLPYLTCERVGTASLRPADLAERFQQSEMPRSWHSQEHVDVRIQSKVDT